MDSEGIQLELSAAASKSAAEVLNEDALLALLQHRDLPPETLEEISRNGTAVKSRNDIGRPRVSSARPETPRSPAHSAVLYLRPGALHIASGGRR